MNTLTTIERGAQPKSSHNYERHKKLRAIEVSVVMPCLNEAETLAVCIQKAQRAFQDIGISGEVVVADNGSTDGSQEIVFQTGARLAEVKQKGYGAALRGGVAEARGRFIIMGDADGSYDFSSLGPFIEKLRGGYDLVMGNRFKGGIKSGAMPLLHKYLGNPVLSALGRMFFGSPCGDFHCGLRGFSRAAFTGLELRAMGMEFASEMVVKATLQGLRIAEVPVTLCPDGRSRLPHLRTWQDGWRHLRFLLVYCPRWIFLYPGVLLMLLGVGGWIWLTLGPRKLGGGTFDIHILLYSALAINIGFQAISLAAFTKIYGICGKLAPKDSQIEKLLKRITLEVGVVIGSSLVILGILGSVFAVYSWGASSFDSVDFPKMFRLVLPAATVVALGFQVVLSSFFLSVLGLRQNGTNNDT
ncbi:MAG: glycosyltransferase family 2 protein [Nitrospira defluvii]|nr:glycosyltransferase family 2 protein [Nitrospira defluvii]